ncbi:MAG: TIGR02221 family CRISPR-associated protein [Saprospiraceae bacterium]
MAKVLISFLGTGPQIKVGQDKPNRDGYLKASYSIENKIYKDKNFVADAIVEHFEIDKIIIAGTMKSIWEKFYEVFSKKENTYDEDFELGLWDITHNSTYQTLIDKTDISKINNKISFPTKPIVIHYGLNDIDFQENFNLLVNSIIDDNFVSEGDTIILDITHAFRSIPIYLMMVIMYLRDVKPKNVIVQDILYGMYDVKWEMENYYVPIVSLKPTLNILDWIKGAYAFQSFGNGHLIGKLLNNKGEEDLSKHITNLSNAFGINYASNVKSHLDKLNEINLKNLNIPESLIVPKVLENFKKQFKYYKKESHFQIELADWYYHKQLYDSAYILLAESLITFVCEEDGFSDIGLKANRDIAKSKIYDTSKYDINQKGWFSTINKIRNDIAHASIGNRESIENDIIQLKNRIQKAKHIIYKR